MTRMRLYKSDRTELAVAAPAAPLRALVRSYTAWFDPSTAVVRRRHVPSGHLALIVNIGGRVREQKAGSARWTEYRTFASGLHEAYTLSESSGPNLGVQVDFTALGARLFYSQPLDDLANRTVALDDVLGRYAERLTAMLFEAPDWESRFALLDREIGARVDAARQPSPEVVAACGMIARSAGLRRIADVVREVGWSERHLATRFRNEYGLAPKAYARVVRFDRAVRLISSTANPSLADVAVSCGYYDQAHLTRDVHALAGVTPLGLLESRMPLDGGFTARS